MWRETASLPKNKDWSFNYSKVKRARRARQAQAACKKLPKPNPIKNVTIKATVTLESLGLSFTPTAVRQATIVG